MAIPFYRGPIPALATPQMVEVDRAMMEDYKIELIQMMENAGRNLAHLARERFLAQNPGGKRVIVLAGTGGNGGGTLASARRLHNWGVQVTVVTTRPAESFTSIPAHQLTILQRMRVPVLLAEMLKQVQMVDLILDGIIGYSLKGAPRGVAAAMIRWANEQDAPVLALDTPSGVDAGTGAVFDPAIRAAATMTLALPKRGLLTEDAAAYVGELYLADISAPPALYESPALGLKVGPIFALNDIVRLR